MSVCKVLLKPELYKIQLIISERIPNQNVMCFFVQRLCAEEREKKKKNARNKQIEADYF